MPTVGRHRLSAHVTAAEGGGAATAERSDAAAASKDKRKWGDLRAAAQAALESAQQLVPDVEAAKQEAAAAAREADIAERRGYAMRMPLHMQSCRMPTVQLGLRGPTSKTLA